MRMAYTVVAALFGLTALLQAGTPEQKARDAVALADHKQVIVEAAGLLKEHSARDTLALADTIDRLLTDRWSAEGMRPAPIAEDNVFVRRVYLDLAGHIPAIYEVRDFLDDPAP